MEDPIYSAEQPVLPQETAPQSDIAPATITSDMLREIRQTAPWMTFMSILGFVACGLMLLAGIALFFLSSKLSLPIPPSMGLVYIIMAVIIFFPYLYLYQTAESFRGFVQRGDVNAMETALMLQKKFWRYLGILTLVYMAVLALMMLIGFLAVILGS